MLNFNNIHISHGVDELKNWNNKIISRGEIIIALNNKKIDRIIIGNGEPLVLYDENNNLLPIGIKYTDYTNNIEDYANRITRLEELVTGDGSEEILLSLKELNEQLLDLDKDGNIDLIKQVADLDEKVSDLESNNKVIGGNLYLGEEGNNNDFYLSDILIEDIDINGEPINFDERYLKIRQDKNLSGRLVVINEEGYLTFSNNKNPETIKNWETFQTLVRAGEITDYYEVGDIVTCLDIYGNKLNWRILGFDHDIQNEIVNNNYEHSVTLQLIDAMVIHDTNSTLIKMNEQSFEENGNTVRINYKDSYLRNYLNTTFYYELEQEFRDIIQPVAKQVICKMAEGSSDFYFETIEDKVFIPSSEEVYGIFYELRSIDNFLPREGVVYDYYLQRSQEQGFDPEIDEFYPYALPHSEEWLGRILTNSKDLEVGKYWLRSQHMGANNVSSQRVVASLTGGNNQQGNIISRNYYIEEHCLPCVVIY